MSYNKPSKTNNIVFHNLELRKSLTVNDKRNCPTVWPVNRYRIESEYFICTQKGFWTLFTQCSKVSRSTNIWQSLSTRLGNICEM